MAQTTFSGPVNLKRFVTAGPDSVVNITAETTLTLLHAGKVIKVMMQMEQSHFQQSKQKQRCSAGDNDPMHLTTVLFTF